MSADSLSVEIQASVDLADGNNDLTEGVPESLRQPLALVVDIPLGHDVFKVERIGIGLIGEGGAMADDDHKPSSPQCLRDILIIRGRRAWPSDAEHGKQTKRDRERYNGSSRQSKHCAAP